MLDFRREKNGNYLVVETIIPLERKYIRYDSSLTRKKVNGESWRPITAGDREWFEKHYRKYFKSEIIKPIQLADKQKTKPITPCPSCGDGLGEHEGKLGCSTCGWEEYDEASKPDKVQTTQQVRP